MTRTLCRPRRQASRGRILAVAALALAACSAGPSQQPHFGGTWVLDLGRSRLEVPAPDSTIFVVTDGEPVVRIFRTHIRGGAADTATVVLRTDSSQVEWAIGTTKLISRTWWEGNELVFWTAFADRQRPGSQVVRYSISENGRTLTAVEQVDAPNASHVNRWVFNRRD